MRQYFSDFARIDKCKSNYPTKKIPVDPSTAAAVARQLSAAEAKTAVYLFSVLYQRSGLPWDKKWPPKLIIIFLICFRTHHVQQGQRICNIINLWQPYSVLSGR
jgi:hypothetical protein